MFRLVYTYFLGISMWLIFACNQQSEKEVIPPKSENNIFDTASIFNDFKNNILKEPGNYTEIDSSGILIYPLLKNKEIKGDTAISDKGFPLSYYWNIIFYNSNTSSYHLLSDREMIIGGFDVKNNPDYNTRVSSDKRKIFFLVTVDDFNNDMVLSAEDPEYLFITDKDGNNFKQISPAGHDLRNWEYIRSSNKVIMQVKKDSDGNKLFNDKDELITLEIEL